MRSDEKAGGILVEPMVKNKAEVAGDQGICCLPSLIKGLGYSVNLMKGVVELRRK